MRPDNESILLYTKKLECTPPHSFINRMSPMNSFKLAINLIKAQAEDYERYVKIKNRHALIFGIIIGSFITSIITYVLF